MTTQIASYGFFLAALAFVAVAAVLLLGWRGRAVGLAPLLAVVAAAIWGAGLGAAHATEVVLAPLVAALDALRVAGWSGLLLAIVATLGRGRVFWTLLGATVLVVGGELALAATTLSDPASSAGWARGVPAVCGILGAVLGLVLIEQVYRNAGAAGRWALKYLCIGLGAIFAYDLFLFSDAWLMRQPDPALWAARGYVNALAAPLIAVTAARNPSWSLDVYVSRRLVLHTASLAAVGGYLIVVSVVAWSLRAYGGAWSVTVQAVFLVASMMLLAMLFFSGQIRAKARIFLSKHFYNYRYDYREEWLRFSRTMTAGEDETPLRERAIQALAQVVESPAGLLWQVREARFEVTASWNVAEPPDAGEPVDGDLARFLAETGWVLTLREWREEPSSYRGLPVPAWLEETPRAWAIVPLLHHRRLEGFVLMTRPRTGASELNWEDYDLLKIIGRQVASYLAQDDAARALARVQQFETFNRLSAFVLHDLKNIIGQVSMLARNARRHRDNPAFMADAVETLDHCVARMNQLMNQLRSGTQPGMNRWFDLGGAIAEAIDAHGEAEPKPVLERSGRPITVYADRARLVAVVGNLIQNAQDATPADGRIRVAVVRTDAGAAVSVEDTGCGMSREFIRQRLFRPFDTSKGSTGMGIGAFEAREFARALGGDLQVESTPGTGTRFTMQIPDAVLGAPVLAVEGERG